MFVAVNRWSKINILNVKMEFSQHDLVSIIRNFVHLNRLRRLGCLFQSSGGLKKLFYKSNSIKIKMVCLESHF